MSRRISEKICRKSENPLDNAFVFYYNIYISYVVSLGFLSGYGKDSFMIRKKITLLLLLCSLFTVVLASAPSFAAAESLAAETEQTYSEGVLLFENITKTVGESFASLANVASVTYTSTYTYLEATINGILDFFAFPLPAGMPMMLLGLLCAICGLCFFLFGSKTWKIVLRILFYVIAYFVGYYGSAALMTMFPALLELPFAEYYPIAVGVLFGLIGCIFTSFCLRVSLFMGAVGAAYLLLPAFVTPMIDPNYIFSYELLMICYLTIGAIVGYLLAFRFMRPLLVLGSIASAGIGITFGAFSLFLAPVFTNIGLSVDLYFWIIAGGVSLLSAILSAIRAYRRKRKEADLALETV